MEVVKRILIHKIEQNLTFRTFNQDLFKNALTFLEKNKIMSFAKRTINNFGKGNIIKNNEKIHEFIKENNLIEELFNGINTNENLNYFLSIPEFELPHFKL